MRVLKTIVLLGSMGLLGHAWAQAPASDACIQCHQEVTPGIVQQHQEGKMSKVVKEMDKLMAAAIREVQALYEEGVLRKPEGWTFAPDLLQFYQARSTIEQELYVMFREYRMRAFQGAFHMNPDYMHWYGWAPMKESLRKIQDEANRMRPEHKMAAG